MPLASVVVFAVVDCPSGSIVTRRICLPETEVPVDVTVNLPERVKALLTAGFVLEVVRKSRVGVGIGVGVGVGVGSSAVTATVAVGLVALT